MLQTLELLAQQLSQIRAHYLPAFCASLISAILAGLVLTTSVRRRFSRAMALVLFSASLWQGSIVFYVLAPRLSVAFATLFGGLMLFSAGILKEMMLAPWRPFLRCIWNVRLGFVFLPIYGFAFTPWFIPVNHFPDYHMHGPMYWVINSISFVWGGFLLVDTVRIARSRELVGVKRNELVALTVVMTSAWLAFALGFVLRFAGLLQVKNLPVIIFIGGLVHFSIMMGRYRTFDAKDLWRTGLLVCGAGVVILLAEVFIISILHFFSISPNLPAAAFAVLFVGFGIWFAEYRIRNFIASSVKAPRFIDAQAFINSLAYDAPTATDLHGHFVRLLRRWSDGSPRVYLSTALFAGHWPPVPIPDSLPEIVKQRKWLTPDSLDIDDGDTGAIQAYFLENKIGAIVCSSTDKEENLVAVLEERESQRPFVARELHEAHELMRAMQMSLAIVEMRQSLRGQDRLGVYSQFAPQFAHELRNGLHMQVVLLRAIEEGRAHEVAPRDLKTAFGKLEQVERLCAHFLSIGTMYKRPSTLERIRPVFDAVIQDARASLGGDDDAEIILSADVADNDEFVINSDLFKMAMLNLIKNAVEAQRDSDRGIRVEIVAAKVFERIHVMVSDRGPGLPEGRRLDPFAPGDSSKPNGLGLGLSIAKDCMEAMGGTIGLRESNESGTCFELSVVAGKSKPTIE